MQFPVPPGKGEEWFVVMFLLYGRLLFCWLIVVHTFPLVLRVQSSHPNLWHISIGFNLIALVLFMWASGFFPYKLEHGRKPIRSLMISRCAHCKRSGWSIGKGVVKDYIYWWHDECDTKVQNKKAQDDLLQALKGIK